MKSVNQYVKENEDLVETIKEKTEIICKHCRVVIPERSHTVYSVHAYDLFPGVLFAMGPEFSFLNPTKQTSALLHSELDFL